MIASDVSRGCCDIMDLDAGDKCIFMGEEPNLNCVMPALLDIQ
jgi:hypothetical protein